MSSADCRPFCPVAYEWYVCIWLVRVLAVTTGTTILVPYPSEDRTPTDLSPQESQTRDSMTMFQERSWPQQSLSGDLHINSQNTRIKTKQTTTKLYAYFMGCIAGNKGISSLHKPTDYQEISWNLEPRDTSSVLSDRSEIWQVHRQQCCRLT